MRSIRLRIGLSVFGVVLFLLIAQAVILLREVCTAAWSEVDLDLAGELAELVPLLGTEGLLPQIEIETKERTKWDELFIEVLTEGGRRVAASANVPEGGLPANPGAGADETKVRVWEAVHPASRSGHRRIRIAEQDVGGYRLRVARTLKRQQRQYWALRQKLALALLVVAIVGAAASWFVATRALRPVRLMANRARELGTLVDGDLPRSGSGDELDVLAGVLNELLAKIREEIRRIRRMTGDVGHSLRTPLTALRGTLELLLTKSSDAATAGQLEGAMEELDRLIRLVNRLLMLEKLESGVAQNDALPLVEVAELSREIIDHLEVLADDQGVRITSDLEPVSMRADPGQLSQAVASLLENAIGHTPRGGLVQVHLRRVGRGADLVVEDSGLGVPEADLDRVFDRFYSTSSSGGTGLGLPIARAVARFHGGELRVEPGPRGRFVLSLPASPGC